MTADALRCRTGKGWAGLVTSFATKEEEVGTVIVHFDEQGELTYLVNGENVRLYIVDERAPGDRVYEWLPRDSDEEIAAVVPVGETIGNGKDERHEVLAHRVRSAQSGVPHLSAIEEPPHA